MAKQAIKPEPVERLPLHTRKRCSECGEIKELWKFNSTEANIGRRKSYCKECETELVNPKVPPKIVGKGKPIFGFGGVGETVKESNNKVIKKVTSKKQEEKPKPKPVKKSRKGKKKTMEWRDEMQKKQEKILKDAMELLETTIEPYIKEHPFASEHGFQAKNLWQDDLKAKYPNNQYFTTLLRRLVKTKKLKVKRQRGKPHTYFLITDGRTGKAPEKVVKKARIDFDKVTTIPLKKVQDMGKIEVKEEEEKEILKKVKGESKMKKSEKEGFDDDFLRGISTIADKVEIDFVERTTEIIISPSGNLLRVYDLLSKKQKENAVVDGKNLKFTW